MVPTVMMLLAWTVLHFLSAAHLSAQAVPAPSRKSPVAAGLLEWFTVPTIGYAYAGDWSRGIPSGLTRVAGFGLVMSAVNDDSGEAHARAAVGLVMFLGASVWAVIDAAHTAERQNERSTSTSTGVSAIPTIDDGRVGMRVRMALGR